MRLLVIACYLLTVCLTLYAELVCARERPLNSSQKIAFPVDVTNVTAHARSKRQPPDMPKTNALTEETRKQMLDLHNEFRAKRNSSYMLMMEWNNELAMMAQEHSNLCDNHHSKGDVRNNKAGFENVGENLHATSAPFEPLNSVQGWYDENKFYNLQNGQCSLEPCGHYTQLVWSNTKAVGCGVKWCDPMTGVTKFTAGHLITCRYGPGGNIGLHVPYKVGEPCSLCPDDAKYCIKGLCSSTAAAGPMPPMPEGSTPMPGGGTPMPGGGTPMPGGDTPMPGGDTTTMPPAGTAAIQPRTSWIGLMLMIVVHLIVIGTI